MGSVLIEAEAKKFAEDYAALFAVVDSSSSETIAQVAEAISKCYKPGVTFFTNGQIERYQTQAESARLIAAEMRKAHSDGLGVHLLIQDISTVAYSDTAVTCHLTWIFQPQAGSEFAERPWTFTNIYGYRAATAHGPAGWEYVLRDREVIEMVKTTGKAFNE